MLIRSTIVNLMVEIADEHDKKLAPINNDLALHESGLDSLAIAVLVARLEDQLDANPFTNFADVALPMTIGEFIRLYENDASDAAAAPVNVACGLTAQQGALSQTDSIELAAALGLTTRKSLDAA